MAAWQIQDAKARLGELIERARSEGPQTIAGEGSERAVVLSIEDYRALTAQKPDFKAYLLGGPKVEEFEIERDPDTGRSAEAWLDEAEDRLAAYDRGEIASVTLDEMIAARKNR